jgi:hypothetical protein
MRDPNEGLGPAIGVEYPHPLLSESQERREACIAALKKRPLESFMPMLIAAEPTVLDTAHEFNILSNGTVVQDHEFLFKDSSGYLRFHSRDVDANMTGWRDQFMAEFRISLAEGKLAALETRRNQVKQRVDSLVFELTPFKKEGGVQRWHEEWDDYCESYTPPRYPSSSWSMQLRFTVSCFPAGTRISTLSGLQAIETIRVGDCVLAQNSQTGELAYKPVQRVTLRPPSRPLIKISTQGETLTATRGHPFWVNGTGWLMAKQLKVGDVLHTLNGAAVIDSLEEAPAQEAYNLIVSEFGSYFAGDQQLLVHDNSPLPEAVALVPGMTANNKQ